MIVKILMPAKGFPGVAYNTGKVDRNKAELLRVANFGSLQALSNLRPQDYINYLQMISALNPRVVKPQLHSVISARGKSYSKDELAVIGELWLKEMGYGLQPYLLVFHKDTDNNHVHMVTTRVDREGKKIDSAFEKIRSVRALEKVLGYDLGLQYNFSTKAQFYMVLESHGFLGRDFDDKRLQQKIDRFAPNPLRIEELKAIFMELKNEAAFAGILHDRYGIDLHFHAAAGKAPYGYTIIDHASMTVFKGSTVMSLKELIGGSNDFGRQKQKGSEKIAQVEPVHVQPVWIASDIDDEAIHGRNRKRKKKARTNSR